MPTISPHMFSRQTNMKLGFLVKVNNSNVLVSYYSFKLCVVWKFIVKEFSSSHLCHVLSSFEQPIFRKSFRMRWTNFPSILFYLKSVFLQPTTMVDRRLLFRHMVKRLWLSADRFFMNLIVKCRHRALLSFISNHDWHWAFWQKSFQVALIVISREE